MPYQDCSFKVVDIPDERGWLNTTWGVAIGNTSLSYFCSYCNVLWRANFPRKQMIKDAKDADKSPCPGCIQKILVKVENNEGFKG